MYERNKVDKYLSLYDVHTYLYVHALYNVQTLYTRIENRLSYND